MHFQALESRRHFSVSHSLDAAGTLTVQGDGAHDVITVQESGSYLVVSGSAADPAWRPSAFVGPVEVQAVSPEPSVRVALAPPGGYPLSAVKKIVVRGGGGDDQITVNSAVRADVAGDAGNDVIHAGAGDDLVDGGEGDDAVHGRWGDDRVRGARGEDVVDGGDGDDLIIDDAASEIAADVYAGGGGRDHLSYAGRTCEIRINPNDGVAWDGGYDEGWIGPRTEGDNVGSDIEDFTGGSDKDTIYGTPGNNSIWGGPGSDCLYGGAPGDHAEAGDDTLHGGDGNDFLEGRAGNDTLFGGAGLDWLNGDAGDDRLVGGAGVDKLFGGDGNDSIDARDGSRDRIDGGEGVDFAYVDHTLSLYSTVVVEEDILGVEAIWC